MQIKKQSQEIAYKVRKMLFVLILVALMCENSLSGGPTCETPDNLNGYCVKLKKCSHIYDESTRRKNDPEFVTFIQQLNKNCNYERHKICCSYEVPPTTPLSKSSTTIHTKPQTKSTTTTQRKHQTTIKLKPKTTIKPLQLESPLDTRNESSKLAQPDQCGIRKVGTSRISTSITNKGLFMFGTEIVIFKLYF